MWHQKQVPHDFKNSNIVHLYRQKRNRKICDNHGVFSLLSITVMFFASMLLNCLNGHLNQGLIPESQCGFRRHRVTTDMISAARQLQEKYQEMRTHLYTTFVYPTNAFDTVNHDRLWKVIQNFGCPKPILF
ncbi:unnamed protein product [Schistocephalus solidus]|uniref:Reverse transcriptase domain-containing protein n=1 Tax=Schistocephalus solidus TaxID=70667 RepID=A0A183TNZ7_SCHSO|nr:unnamed protein product [Schistocephalus solidus]